ncbi:hypothetical protein AB1K91_15450, partial [Terribacillus sp. 179-K 1B1 HS]|uniref:hypothetical protein n=1 Tax=Terribacillus sp. 179-K 1B1 HS TaxID=3142388 RepID=UPI0039A26F6B
TSSSIVTISRAVWSFSLEFNISAPPISRLFYYKKVRKRNEPKIKRLSRLSRQPDEDDTLVFFYVEGAEPMSNCG